MLNVRHICRLKGNDRLKSHVLCSIFSDTRWTFKSKNRRKRIKRFFFLLFKTLRQCLDLLSYCPFNFNVNTFSACGVGRFGTGCNHTCYCSDNNSCDAITGTCQKHGCFPGWRGESCDLSNDGFILIKYP